MKPAWRKVICIVGSAVFISTTAITVQVILPSDSAVADTCVGVGRRASVNTCADLTDVVGGVLTPGRPDRGPGNLTPNVYSCLGWDGRWVESNSCT
jgi:hypothetical protein